MEKISKHTIFDDVLYGPEHSDQQIKQTGTSVNITPGAVIGALTGVGVAKMLADRKAKNDILIASLPKGQRASSFANKGYYSQVENIIKTLSIVFTPVSVIYNIKDGNKDVTIDIIHVDNEMTPQMRLAWANRDEEYFKNFLINKIKSDVQMVEQHFADHLLSAHFKEKKAGLYASIEKTAAAKMKYEADPEFAERSAEAFLKLAKEVEIGIDVCLDRPFSDYSDAELTYDFLSYQDKYASFSDPKVLTPAYMINRMKVVYFPDRIIFVVDNKAISTLPASSMDDREFDLFKKQDSHYFKKVFEKSMKDGASFIKIRPEAIEKHASEEDQPLTIDPSSLFKMNSVNPVLYLLLLNKQYTQEWLTFEPLALIKMIETDFNLDQGINDVALNKILSVRTCNATTTPYVNSFAFEKVLRSFTNLPINFFEAETKDIGLKEIAYGLETFDLVTPDDDTYDNFGLEVFNYLVNIIKDKNCAFFLPDKNSSKSLKHDDFYKILNSYLLDANIANNISEIDDLQTKAKLISDQELLQSLTKEILLSFHENQAYVLDDKKLVAMIKSNGGDPSLLEVAKRQAIQNLEVDNYVNSQIQSLGAQMNLYGVSLTEE